MRKLLAMLLCCLPLSSYAWWSEEWNFRKEITLDLSPAAASIAGSVSDVPVLIRLHLGNFGYFADTKPDGSDLRVVAGDDKTPLKFHVERYDPVNQMAFIWVRVPQAAGATNSTRIFLYYGNSKADALPKPAETYDASQLLTLHFTDQASVLSDATAFANNATASSAEVNAASLIGTGVRFAGMQSLTVPASASLRVLPAKGATLSSWVRIDQSQTDAYVMALEDQGRHFILGIRGDKPYVRMTGAGGDVEAVATTALPSGSWHHLAATLGSGKLQVLVDGVETASAAVQPVEIAGTLTIGNSAAGDRGLVGELDEVQAASVARAADWLKAAATSQGQESIMMVYGADAQREGEEVNYFAETMKNVTPDGWVVIIVLAIMFVIAVLIMMAKGLYLARVKHANAAFIKEFEKVRGDPTALDQAEEEDGDEALNESVFMPHLGEQQSKYKYSTLYRLYHHGVQEMTGRVGKSVGAGAVTSLTPQAMNAIRATMDANSVRLTQKLQARMVLLTIAISGGPFIGLLGTVVGVMITFAAIAASGDVNVNAIAPGIAAALAATVAGMGVAIPTLFGYNWLNAQIKEINADMRVFIDEFVTRVAERYS